MGFDSKNVILIQNEHAAKADMEKYLGSWLKNRGMTKKSRVFIYYAGHGAPNSNTNQGFLVPFDGDPNYTEDTAYSINRLYSTLTHLPTKDITVVLDSCFSGGVSRFCIGRCPTRRALFGREGWLNSCFRGCPTLSHFLWDTY